MVPTNEDELLGVLVHISSEMSVDLIGRLGVLPFWGFSLHGPNFSPNVFVPSDKAPADFTLEWLATTLREELHQRASAEPEIPGIATIHPGERDGKRCAYIQVETEGTLATFALPYERESSGKVSTGSPEYVQGMLLVQPALEPWASQVKLSPAQ
jgi:hypothetical protein